MRSLDHIKARLKHLYRRRQRHICIVGAAWTAVWLLACTAFVCILDYIFTFPFFVRLGTCILIYTSTLVFSWYFWGKQASKPFSPKRAAWIIEKLFPELNEKLVSAVEFADSDSEHVSADFIGRIISEAEQELHQPRFDPPNVFPFQWRRLQIPALVTLVALFCNAMPVIPAGTLTSRILAPSHQDPSIGKTRLYITTPEEKFVYKEGADIPVKIQVKHASFDYVTLVTENEDIDTKRLEKEADNRTFETTIENVQEDFVFWARHKNMRSSTYQVRVRKRPQIQRITVSYDYPAYTGLKNGIKKNGGGAVRVLKGTEVEITLETSQKIASAEIRALDNQLNPVYSADRKKISFSFTVHESGSYTVDLVNTNGLRLQEKIQHPVEAKEDAPPSISLNEPARDVFVAPWQKRHIKWHADDDYGIKDVTLVTRVPQNDLRQTRTFAPDIEEARLDVGKLACRRGQRVELYLKARDRAGQTARTSKRFLLLPAKYDPDRIQRYLQNVEGVMQAIDKSIQGCGRLTQLRMIFRSITPNKADFPSDTTKHYRIILKNACEKLRSNLSQAEQYASTLRNSGFFPHNWLATETIRRLLQQVRLFSLSNLRHNFHQSDPETISELLANVKDTAATLKNSVRHYAAVDQFPVLLETVKQTRRNLTEKEFRERIDFIQDKMIRLFPNRPHNKKENLYPQGTGSRAALNQAFKNLKQKVTQRVNKSRKQLPATSKIQNCVQTLSQSIQPFQQRLDAYIENSLNTRSSPEWERIRMLGKHLRMNTAPHPSAIRHMDYRILGDALVSIAEQHMRNNLNNFKRYVAPLILHHQSVWVEGELQRLHQRVTTMKTLLDADKGYTLSHGWKKQYNAVLYREMLYLKAKLSALTQLPPVTTSQEIQNHFKAARELVEPGLSHREVLSLIRNPDNLQQILDRWASQTGKARKKIRQASEDTAPRARQVRTILQQTAEARLTDVSDIRKRMQNLRKKRNEQELPAGTALSTLREIKDAVYVKSDNLKISAAAQLNKRRAPATNIKNPLTLGNLLYQGMAPPLEKVEEALVASADQGNSDREAEDGNASRRTKNTGSLVNGIFQLNQVQNHFNTYRKWRNCRLKYPAYSDFIETMETCTTKFVNTPARQTLADLNTTQRTSYYTRLTTQAMRENSTNEGPHPKNNPVAEKALHEATQALKQPFKTRYKYYSDRSVYKKLRHAEQKTRKVLTRSLLNFTKSGSQTNATKKEVPQHFCENLKKMSTSLREATAATSLYLPIQAFTIRHMFRLHLEPLLDKLKKAENADTETPPELSAISQELQALIGQIQRTRRALTAYRSDGNNKRNGTAKQRRFSARIPEAMIPILKELTHTLHRLAALQQTESSMRKTAHAHLKEFEDFLNQVSKDGNIQIRIQSLTNSEESLFRRSASERAKLARKYADKLRSENPEKAAKAMALVNSFKKDVHNKEQREKIEKKTKQFKNKLNAHITDLNRKKRQFGLYQYDLTGRTLTCLRHQINAGNYRNALKTTRTLVWNLGRRTKGNNRTSKPSRTTRKPPGRVTDRDQISSLLPESSPELFQKDISPLAQRAIASMLERRTPENAPDTDTYRRLLKLCREERFADAAELVTSTEAETHFLTAAEYSNIFKTDQPNIPGVFRVLQETESSRDADGTPARESQPSDRIARFQRLVDKVLAILKDFRDTVRAEGVTQSLDMATAVDGIIHKLGASWIRIGGYRQYALSHWEKIFTLATLLAPHTEQTGIPLRKRKETVLNQLDKLLKTIAAYKTCAKIQPSNSAQNKEAFSRTPPQNWYAYSALAQTRMINNMEAVRSALSGDYFTAARSMQNLATRFTDERQIELVLNTADLFRTARLLQRGSLPAELQTHLDEMRPFLVSAEAPDAMQIMARKIVSLILAKKFIAATRLLQSLKTNAQSDFPSEAEALLQRLLDLKPESTKSRYKRQPDKTSLASIRKARQHISELKEETETFLPATALNSAMSHIRHLRFRLAVEELRTAAPSLKPAQKQHLADILHYLEDAATKEYGPMNQGAREILHALPPNTPNLRSLISEGHFRQAMGQVQRKETAQALRLLASRREIVLPEALLQGINLIEQELKGQKYNEKAQEALRKAAALARHEDPWSAAELLENNFNIPREAGKAFEKLTRILSHAGTDATVDKALKALKKNDFTIAIYLVSQIDMSDKKSREIQKRLRNTAIAARHAFEKIRKKQWSYPPKNSDETRLLAASAQKLMKGKYAEIIPSLRTRHKKDEALKATLSEASTVRAKTVERLENLKKEMFNRRQRLKSEAETVILQAGDMLQQRTTHASPYNAPSGQHVDPVAAALARDEPKQALQILRERFGSRAKARNAAQDFAEATDAYAATLCRYTTRPQPNDKGNRSGMKEETKSFAIPLTSDSPEHTETNRKTINSNHLPMSASSTGYPPLPPEFDEKQLIKTKLFASAVKLRTIQNEAMERDPNHNRRFSGIFRQLRNIEAICFGQLYEEAFLPPLLRNFRRERTVSQNGTEGYSRTTLFGRETTGRGFVTDYPLVQGVSGEKRSTTFSQYYQRAIKAYFQAITGGDKTKDQEQDQQ